MTDGFRPKGRASFLVRTGALLERRTVAAILVLCGAAWLLVELAGVTGAGDVHALDRAILLAMRSPDDPADPLGPVWFEEMARDVTALGGTGLLVLVTLAAAGLLALRGRVRSMWFLLLATGSGQVVGLVAKALVERPRPDLVPHGTTVLTASFPSGHAMMAALTYLTLAALLARSQPHRRVKLFLLSVAVIVTLLVGASRVYLGVHWPSDVLGGWTAGAAWALACLLLAGLLRRVGLLEPAAR